MVGWVLVACVLLTGKSTTTINGVETEHTLLPEGISSIVSIIYGLSVFVLFVYGIIKYKKLKNEKNNHSQSEPAQQPVQSMMNQEPLNAQQPVQPVMNQGAQYNDIGNQNPFNSNN